MSDILLRYWKCKKGSGNFGDELSPYLVSTISKRRVNHNAGDDPGLVAVGSYLHMTRNGDNVWGTGIRSFENGCSADNLNVHLVRGPLTRNFLIDNKHIECPENYGDPVLSLPLFYQPKPVLGFEGKVGVLMNCATVSSTPQMDKSVFKIIDPFQPWQKVVDEITSCKLIVSNGLHGLIISDAYGIPSFRSLKPSIEEGDFKFNDYAASQCKELSSVSTIHEVLKCSSPNLHISIDPFNIINSFSNTI